MGKATGGPVSPPKAPEPNPFPFGYRLVPKTGADGEVDYDYVPLTLEDLLHPDEACVIVQNTPHQRDRHYLFGVLARQLEGRPGARVFDDLQVIWDNDGPKPHSPDLSVFFGLRDPEAVRTSIDVVEEGVLPSLIIEIVSPDYRVNDVVTKFEQYHQARLPLYVIVDRKRPEGPATVVGYRYTLDGYVEMETDDDGRLWLQPVELWLGASDNRAICFDKKGNELGDYVRVVAELEEAEKRAERERKRAEREARRAEKQAKRADEEAAARAQAEEQVRRLEEELRKLRERNGPG